MTIKDFEQLRSMKKEISTINDRIDRYEKKASQIVFDSVKGSSDNFPYTERRIKIRGYDKKYHSAIQKNLDTLVKKEVKLEEKVAEVEEFLNSLEDSEIRQIIRLRYLEGYTWRKVARILYKVPNEDRPRKKIERFFEKI